MVSHDRHLIGLVCETFWRVAGGKVEAFDGDLDEYAAWLRSRPGNEPAKAGKPAKAAPVAAPLPSKAPARINPHKLAKAEARVAELETRLAAIDAELADPRLYAQDNGARAAQLGREQGELRAELEAAEQALLALYEAA
jgi:ATP-binding cassette subfamily F protein 3